jgi:hypothetical protein
MNLIILSEIIGLKLNKKVTMPLQRRQRRRRNKTLAWPERFVYPFMRIKLCDKNGDPMKRNFMKKFFALLSIAFIMSLNVPAKPLETNQNAAKIEQMLKQANLNYRRASDNVWIVKTKGKVLPEFEILVAENQNVLVIGVVMLNKKNLKLSQDLLFKLLKFNHQKDYVKVGIDDDDDIFVRSELNLSQIDALDFAFVFRTVVALADDVYTELKPAIIK